MPCRAFQTRPRALLAVSRMVRLRRFPRGRWLETRTTMPLLKGCWWRSTTCGRPLPANRPHLTAPVYRNREETQCRPPLKSSSTHCSNGM
jgi:hypothetical protein